MFKGLNQIFEQSELFIIIMKLYKNIKNLSEYIDKRNVLSSWPEYNDILILNMKIYDYFFFFFCNSVNGDEIEYA